jgi:hypothetical protein
MKIALIALSLALVPVSGLAAPTLKPTPSLPQGSVLDATTCLWAGQRYSLGAFFCAGVASAERCVAADEAHDYKAWWMQEDAGEHCAESKYPNESVTVQVPNVNVTD